MNLQANNTIVVNIIFKSILFNNLYIHLICSWKQVSSQIHPCLLNCFYLLCNLMSCCRIALQHLYKELNLQAMQVHQSFSCEPTMMLFLAHIFSDPWSQNSSFIPNLHEFSIVFGQQYVGSCQVGKRFTQKLKLQIEPMQFHSSLCRRIVLFILLLLCF